MDIRVGKSQEVGRRSNTAAGPEGFVEARLLSMRPPRRHARVPPGGEDRRDKPLPRDPVNARVLVLDPAGQVVWFHDRGFSVPDLDGMLEYVEVGQSMLGSSR